MSHMEKSDIDELITGFIDGELSQRQLTEVKRLIQHDEMFAEEYVRIKQQKELLGALPSAHAPEDMFDDIKHFLERKHSAEQPGGITAEAAGARHLFLRRMITAAAMFILVGILGVVIFNIVMPMSITEKAMVRKVSPEPDTVAIDLHREQPVQVIQRRPRTMLPLSASLEIRTYDTFSVNNVVEKAIYNNNLLDNTIPRRRTGTSSYEITCPAEQLIGFLGELEVLWTRSGSRDMTVYGRDIESQVVLKDVRLADVQSVLAHDETADYLQFAKDIALLNEVKAQLPAEGLLTTFAFEEEGFGERLSVVKPILTSGKNDSSTVGTNGSEDGGDITLTIVVSGL